MTPITITGPNGTYTVEAPENPLADEAYEHLRKNGWGVSEARLIVTDGLGGFLASLTERTAVTA